MKDNNIVSGIFIFTIMSFIIVAMFTVKYISDQKLIFALSQKPTIYKTLPQKIIYKTLPPTIITKTVYVNNALNEKDKSDLALLKQLDAQVVNLGGDADCMANMEYGSAYIKKRGYIDEVNYVKWLDQMEKVSTYDKSNNIVDPDGMQINY